MLRYQHYMKEAKQKRHFSGPSPQRNVIDYYEAQHQLVADVILHFCQVVKEDWPRPIITGAFYGYFYSVFGREAAGGYLELHRVLNSPYIDYLSAPGTYYSEREKQAILIVQGVLSIQLLCMENYGWMKWISNLL